MPSKDYAYLTKRHTEISETLLPTIRLDGKYTKRESVRIAAYSVLMHAEIEHFLEKCATYVIDKSSKKWNDSKKFTACAGSVLSHYDFKDEKRKKPLHQKLMLSFSHAKNIVSGNNGVRLNDTQKLYNLVGIDDLTPFETLFATLDAFGKRRGALAHKSITSANFLIDALTEKNEVSQIILELCAFDKHIRSINK